MHDGRPPLPAVRDTAAGIAPGVAVAEKFGLQFTRSSQQVYGHPRRSAPS